MHVPVSRGILFFHPRLLTPGPPFLKSTLPPTVQLPLLQVARLPMHLQQKSANTHKINYLRTQRMILPLIFLGTVGPHTENKTYI